MAGGTFGGFCVYCGYGPGTSRLVAGALSRLQSAAPALTQRAKALAGAPEPARVERSCQRDQRLSAPANPLSRSRPDPIRRSKSRQNALEAIRSKSRRASMRKFRCGTRKSRPIQNKPGATTRIIAKLRGKRVAEDLTALLANCHYANWSPYGPPRPEHRRQSPHSARKSNGVRPCAHHQGAAGERDNKPERHCRGTQRAARSHAGR
jgi:hypothetical protein